jgi:uncharacterized membrane protein YfcA
VSLAVIIATGLAGTATNLRQDTVDVPVARLAAPAAVACALVASVLANELNAGVLRRIYGVTALGLGVESVWTAVRAMRPR